MNVLPFRANQTPVPAQADEATLANRFADNPLFKNAAPHTVRVLASSAQLVRERRDTVIARAGQYFPYLGLVLSGTLCVAVDINERLAPARKCAIGVAPEGETFAEFAALDGQRVLGEFCALTDVEYVLMNAQAVHVAMHSDKAFERELTSRAFKRARQAIACLTQRVSQPTLVRVASLLLSFAAPGTQMLPSDPVLRRLTQRQLATMAGTAKEVLARTVGQLERMGALRRERGRIAFLDRTMLLGIVGTWAD